MVVSGFVIQNALPLRRVRDPAVRGRAVRPADGGHPTAGPGWRSSGLQEQRRLHTGAQSCSGP